MIPVIEAEMIALMMVSSPEEAYVSPFGGSARLFSNNPVAFTAPASDGPILFDVSMAITAGSQVQRAARNGRMLPEASIKTMDGSVSADPAEMARGGSVMPVGGLGHGHKGHALTLMTEVLSQALGGYGRAQSTGQSEENSVYLQILDPQAFGSREAYDREVDHLVTMVVESPPDDPFDPVRVPGHRAWQQRAQQIEAGVILDPGTIESLVPYAAVAGIEVPRSINEEEDQ
jgi:L-lactate dehydrogenase